MGFGPHPPTPSPRERGGANLLPLSSGERGLGGEGAPDLGGEVSKERGEGQNFLHAWIEAVRAGRTFVTTGPWIEIDVCGCRSGDVVEANGPVTIAAKAENLAAFEQMELIVGGEAIASVPGEFLQHRRSWVAELKLSFAPTESSWIAARCVGKDGFAHVSPVVVRVGGQPGPHSPGAVAALRKQIERTGEWVDQQGRFANSRRRDQLLARCAEACGKLGASA
jgi:TolB protein